jgi:hypothetical protein
LFTCVKFSKRTPQNVCGDFIFILRSVAFKKFENIMGYELMGLMIF